MGSILNRRRRSQAEGRIYHYLRIFLLSPGAVVSEKRKYLMMVKQVLVSGCFDMLHSGHIAFFEEAAKHGDLHVAVGSDRRIFELRGRSAVNSEIERLYVIEAVGCVKGAFVAAGSGILDFRDELSTMQPDIVHRQRRRGLS